MNVVCVAAHQDDEMNCLGTLIKCAARGDKITVITVSNGDKGGQYDTAMPHEEMARLRMAESAAIVGSLGGSYYCLGQEDEQVEDNRQAREGVARLLRQVGADLVLTCPLRDYNPDHYITGEIVFHAVMLSTVRTMYEDLPVLDHAPAMYYFDSLAGIEFEPTYYVDITAVFARKCALLRDHFTTQMLNMAKFGGWDLVTYSEIMGRFRGLQCGVQYAEAFRPELRWPRGQPGVLLPS
jgi:LmbE family N-acetylglucosaminyl deacetylase